jgi:hypothetical protein
VLAGVPGGCFLNSTLAAVSGMGLLFLPTKAKLNSQIRVRIFICIYNRALQA